MSEQKITKFTIFGMLDLPGEDLYVHSEEWYECMVHQPQLEKSPWRNHNNELSLLMFSKYAFKDLDVVNQSQYMWDISYDGKQFNIEKFSLVYSSVHDHDAFILDQKLNR